MNNTVQTKPFWKHFNKIMWYTIMIVGSTWLVFLIFVSVHLLHGQFWLLPHPFSWMIIAEWLENHEVLERGLTILWILSIPCYLWLIVSGEIIRRKKRLMNLNKSNENNTKY
jgi:hypothetical protein